MKRKHRGPSGDVRQPPAPCRGAPMPDVEDFRTAVMALQGVHPEKLAILPPWILAAARIWLAQWQPRVPVQKKPSPGRPSRVDRYLLRDLDIVNARTGEQVDRDSFARLLEESMPRSKPRRTSSSRKATSSRRRPPGAAEELRQFRALSLSAQLRASGVTRKEAIVGAAKKLSRSVDSIRAWLKAAQRTRDAEMAREYLQWRKHLPINECLLKCIRGWGYGDGKPDTRGHVAGLDHVKQALKKQGIVEVARTTLKARRAPRFP